MSPPVPVPQRRCRNYWADSIGNLEEGNEARSLPLIINGVKCKRDDHIAFRAMYDLKVPQSLYTSVFNLDAFKMKRMVGAVESIKQVPQHPRKSGRRYDDNGMSPLLDLEAEANFLQDEGYDEWNGTDEDIL